VKFKTKFANKYSEISKTGLLRHFVPLNDEWRMKIVRNYTRSYL